jgi:hypothetical protein
MNGSLALKVRIRNTDGKYLSGDLSNWGFSDDSSRALIFDYSRHQVAEQLEELRLTRGIVLEAVPVDPKEVYETCDHCRRFMTAFATFFDGQRFLCFECLAKTSVFAAPQATLPGAGVQPNIPVAP